MTLVNVLAILVWTGAGAVLLYILMAIDSLLTKYKEIEEIKKGNVAVTTRFVLKLIAQGYILSQSIAKSNDLWEALAVSVISFVILYLLESLIRFALKFSFGLKLHQGTQEGNIAHALLAGSFHIVGALIIAACL